MKTHFTYLFSILVALYAPLADAGHEGGNGGGALVCPGGDAVSYDLALALAINPKARFLHTANLKELRKSSSSEIENLVVSNISDLLTSFRALDPDAAEEIVREAREFLNGDFIPNYRIPDLHDSYPSRLAGCEFRYVVRRHNAIWEIDNDTWAQLDLASLTALTLHEAIYAVEKKAPDCQEPVRLTVQILAGALDHLSVVDALNTMRSNFIDSPIIIGQEWADETRPESKRPIQLWPSDMRYPFHLAERSPYDVDNYRFSSRFKCEPRSPSTNTPSFTLRLLGDLAELTHPGSPIPSSLESKNIYAQEHSATRRLEITLSLATPVKRSVDSVRFEMQNHENWGYPTQEIWVPQVADLSAQELGSLQEFKASFAQDQDPAIQYVCRVEPN